jgi:hypothetical protein
MRYNFRDTLNHISIRGGAMVEKIVACNNNKCIKRTRCRRYDLFLKGAKEYTTNGGTPEKGCKKFMDISKNHIHK